MNTEQPSVGPPPPSRDQQARIVRLESTVGSLTRKNDNLVRALNQTKEQLHLLKEQVEQLATPPSTYGYLLGAHTDGTADVMASGRKLRVNVSPEVAESDLTAGREVRLNESLAVVDVNRFEDLGQVVTVHEVLTGDRIVVVLHGEEHRVVRRAASLHDQVLRQGDLVLLEARSGFAFEVIPKAEVEDLILEEVPDISYADIGGLSGQIEAIRDAIELPYLHPELFREHHLRPPKGVLLYGPPGCGKTLIAKAVAASLARQVAELHGTTDRTSYFLNVKGPELLNKYVGETERQIRLIFQRAREHASGGAPVVVFFDEMDSLFRTRGAGLSSDVETTIVPQLLAEIDGVERLENVIVIGASNREDMIDPAILRPGRLDAKIKIDRPDAPSARDIFAKYLTADLPLHADEVAVHGGRPAVTVAAMIDQVVERMYARTPENRYLELVSTTGLREVLYFADLASGAMIQNVVDRAKRMAIKEVLATGVRGIRTGHLMDAYRAELVENEDLPNTTNPDDWMRVSGRKGDRVVEVRRLTTSTGRDSAGRGDASTDAGSGDRDGRGRDVVTDVETHGSYL
ncbi:MAG TPA: proteasome ATPase [Dermatophilaceae bacterium]|nr:proteasome ATPase [Dermatophilaceae bacterium]